MTRVVTQLFASVQLDILKLATFTGKWKFLFLKHPRGLFTKESVDFLNINCDKIFRICTTNLNGLCTTNFISKFFCIKQYFKLILYVFFLIIYSMVSLRKSFKMDGNIASAYITYKWNEFVASFPLSAWLLLRSL